MNTIVCWLWSDPTLIRRSFLPRHVNDLGRMLKRHYEPHRFICIADKSDGLEPHVEWFKTPPEAIAAGNLRSPEGPRFPSCYRRLWGFSEAAKVLGDRILTIDIDLVAVADLAPVFAMSAPFVGWRPYRDWGNQLRYGGGIYLMNPGARKEVWDDFTGQASIVRARSAGFRGSDQAWISYKLSGNNEVVWPKSSGLYSVRDLDAKLTLPKDAVIVQFNGTVKPWDSPVKWVQNEWFSKGETSNATAKR